SGQEDEDAIVQEMCSSLLSRLLVSSRDFDRHWTNTVAEALEKNQPAVSTPGHRECAPSHHESASKEAAEELAGVIEETIGVYERSLSLALLHCEPGTPNRDATAIFDCQRVVGRTMEKEKREEGGDEKVVVAIRRLTRLARTLGGRLTSPYHVANSSVLAAAVCEMGFLLEDQLRGGEGRRLRRGLEEMNEKIVRGMRELLISTRPTVHPTTVPSATTHRSISAPTRKPLVPPGKATVPGKKKGAYGSGATNSPGFLMSTELREARSKLHSVPVAESRYRGKSRERKEGEEGGEKKGGRNRFMIKPDPHCRRGREVASLEQKWAKMMEGEAAFLRSALREERNREEAEGLARSITREVLEEMEGRKRKVL
ncbi:hypothetical protein PMAYCL1PPCAC_11161, partial [Pristionchus mayeri]